MKTQILLRIQEPNSLGGPPEVYYMKAFEADVARLPNNNESIRLPIDESPAQGRYEYPIMHLTHTLTGLTIIDLRVRYLQKGPMRDAEIDWLTRNGFTIERF